MKNLRLVVLTLDTDKKMIIKKTRIHEKIDKPVLRGHLWDKEKVAL
jgi:hypothetical protein